EGDPASVGRKSRIDFAGAVVGDALNARAVLVSRPDVSEVAERDAPGMIIRMACELDRAGVGRSITVGDKNDCENGGEARSSNHQAPPRTGGYYYVSTSGWGEWRDGLRRIIRTLRGLS